VYTLVLKVTQTFVDFILYILKELACARSIERYLVYFHNTKRKSLYDDVTDFFFKDAGSHWLTGVLARKNLLNFFEYFKKNTELPIEILHIYCCFIANFTILCRDL